MKLQCGLVQIELAVCRLTTANRGWHRHQSGLHFHPLRRNTSRGDLRALAIFSTTDCRRVTKDLPANGRAKREPQDYQIQSMLYLRFSGSTTASFTAASPASAILAATTARLLFESIPAASPRGLELHYRQRLSREVRQ